MGAQLTALYTNINKKFDFDVWTIHSAVHKNTGESVSLWIIDNDRLSKKCKNKGEREQYYDLCLQSIQNMRRLRHPKILKILEVNEKKPDIAFASEPVMSSILGKKLHAMDAAYISMQLAEVLGFLNQDARLVHLGLSPTAVVFNNEMSAKLIHFQWSAPVNSDGIVPVPDKLYSSRVMTDYHFKPPEVLAKKETNTQADIFIFGLFMYYAFTGESLNPPESANSISDVLNGLPTRICNIYSVPNEFRQLIQSCLSLEPSSRPSFLQILQDQAFQSMQLKALKYIDMILTKDPADKFKFYKGLTQKLDEFSPTLVKTKILPVFLNECQSNVKFAPILLSSIFKIASSFKQDEFMNIIWKRLSFLTTITNPPEVSIALMMNLKTILSKIDKPLHKDFVFPIIFSALQSPHTGIHKVCLQEIDLIIDEMNENGIKTQILPRVLDLATNSGDTNIVANSIFCIKKCLPKIDNDAFSYENLPRFAQIWQKSKDNNVGLAIVETIESLRSSGDVLMTRAIPIAADIAGSHSVERETKNRICDWMINTIKDFKDMRSDKNFSVTNASNDADNPFTQSQNSTISANATQGNTFRSETSKMQDNAADIFGPSSTTQKNTNSVKPIKIDIIDSNDIFGPSSKPKTNISQSNSSPMDIFGPSSSSSAQKPQNSSLNIDNFQSSSQQKQSASDIFGMPSYNQIPSNQQTSTMDIFGPTSSSSNYQSNPGNSYQQSTNVFRQQQDLSVFNSSNNGYNNYGMNQNPQSVFNGMGNQQQTGSGSQWTGNDQNFSPNNQNFYGQQQQFRQGQNQNNFFDSLF